MCCQYVPQSIIQIEIICHVVSIDTIHLIPDPDYRRDINPVTLTVKYLLHRSYIIFPELRRSIELYSPLNQFSVVLIIIEIELYSACLMIMTYIIVQLLEHFLGVNNIFQICLFQQTAYSRLIIIIHHKPWIPILNEIGTLGYKIDSCSLLSVVVKVGQQVLKELAVYCFTFLIPYLRNYCTCFCHNYSSYFNIPSAPQTFSLLASLNSVLGAMEVISSALPSFTSRGAPYTEP